MQAANPSETIDTRAADAIIRQAQERDLIREARRQAMMKKVAEIRWMLATTHHRTENGEPIDFDEYPYQVEIFKNDATDVTLFGAVQMAKTEYQICDDIAKAICGLKVFHVCETSNKAQGFVSGRLNPVVHGVPFYKQMLEAASARAGGEAADSTRLKHFGDGHIRFVGSRSRNDFFGHPADAISVDDHHLCDANHLPLMADRMQASDWKFVLRCGNPEITGTPENRNIHWEFNQSDMRHWHVPCPYCDHLQILDWWSHFVEEKTNDFGAILELKVRDPEWNESRNTDFRAICTNCHSPMDRLSKEGRWVKMNPSSPRTGFHLSGLFNPKASMNGYLVDYRKGMVDPKAKKIFVNNRLGLPYDLAGGAITEQMLQTVSTGAPSGIPPYRFTSAGHIQWRNLEV